MVSKKYLNTYYAKQFSYDDGLKNETIIRQRSHIILNQIKRLAPQSKTICDVGSGYGFFLDEAKKNGYKTTGVEPAKVLVDYAKKNFGVQSFRGELKDFIASNKQFDVVTCIHVIEHVTNPQQFMSELLHLVKPGGLLYIETPNSDSHLLYVEKEQYTFLIPPHHLWLFSKDSISHLLSKNSQIIYTNTYSYSEHFMGIIKRIMRNKRHSEHVRRAQCGLREESNINASLDFSAMPRNDNINTKMFRRLKRYLSYLLFDKALAPLFTGLLNLHHKGSILELYIKKKDMKSGL